MDRVAPAKIGREHLQCFRDQCKGIDRNCDRTSRCDARKFPSTQRGRDFLQQSSPLRIDASISPPISRLRAGWIAPRRGILDAFRVCHVIIAFHKPYGVLSQFTPDGSAHVPLAAFGFPRSVYPLGRLDADSEGLLLLGDEPGFQAQLLDPSNGHPRLYWVQVERVPSSEALAQLAAGVLISGYRTRPCRASLLDPQPEVPPRNPPIRERKSVADCWIGLELTEGRNRQVRRMTASVGHPTLRLIRVQIGRFELGELRAGTWRVLDSTDRAEVLLCPTQNPRK